MRGKRRVERRGATTASRSETNGVEGGRRVLRTVSGVEEDVTRMQISKIVRSLFREPAREANRAHRPLQKLDQEQRARQAWQAKTRRKREASAKPARITNVNVKDLPIIAYRQARHSRFRPAEDALHTLPPSALTKLGRAYTP